MKNNSSSQGRVKLVKIYVHVNKTIKMNWKVAGSILSVSFITVSNKNGRQNIFKLQIMLIVRIITIIWPFLDFWINSFHHFHTAFAGWNSTSKCKVGSSKRAIPREVPKRQ